MDFERIHCSDDGNFAIVSFTDEEGEIIRGTYCEKIQQCVSLGNTDSVSRFDRFMATYGAGTTRTVKLSTPDSVALPLMEFHENTEGAMIELANSGQPAFLNNHIVTRQILGERALLLAEELISKFPDINLSLSDHADTKTPDYPPKWLTDPK